MTRRPIQRLLPFAAAALLTLGACGNGDDDADAADDDEIASLGTTSTTAPADETPADETTTDTTPAVADDEPPSTESELSTDPEEAALDYAQCMRDHGIDMPDPEFTADGGMVMTSGRVEADENDEGPSLNGPGNETWDAANAECEPIMDAAAGAFTPDPEEQAAMRERMLEYAECMREHGIDMPDPEFDADGRISIQVGGDDGPVDEDEMRAAQEACAPDGEGGPAVPPPPADEGED